MQKLFAYPGGKWPIRNLIVGQFPSHQTFVDVFGGSAAILLTKEPSKGEVFNDANQEIVNFFRVVKHRPAELAERSRHWIHSRQMWSEIKAVPTPVDEVERAFRFWALVVDSFGATGDSFGTTRSGVRSVTRARAHLTLVADRLKDVHIENLDFRKCIRLYDGPDTFFYLDPPYRGTTGGDSHYDTLPDEAWLEMRDLLKSIEGRFLLSHTDDAFVCRLFDGFSIRRIQVRVSLSRKKAGQMRSEVLISNYPLARSLKNHQRREGDRGAAPSAELSGKAVHRPSIRSKLERARVHLDRR
jgi:DNA adenine methylase